MKFAIFASLCLLVGAVTCGKNKKEEESFELDEQRSYRVGSHHGSHHGSRYDAEEMIEYFLKNPVTKHDRECFGSRFKAGDSIDFVIDLAPSPSLDQVDKACANSPAGMYLEQPAPDQTPTRSYINFITLFIDIVTYSMKPEMTQTVIYDSVTKSRLYLRGRLFNESIDISRQYGLQGEHGISSLDQLRVLWPVSTKSHPEGMQLKMGKILVNNLGRMTKLALWNRDNGLPTVLSGMRRSKPVYSIVLTDGSSGASITDLVDDLTRTTVIDIGNRRFVDRLKWDQVKSMPSVFTLTSPQTLPAFAGTVRNMACLLATHFRQSVEESGTSSSHRH